MSAMQNMLAKWDSLAPREKNLVGAALALVGLALLWWLALAPALGTLQRADAERAKLDAQLLQMRSLEAQAKALQGQPKLAYDDALRALEASVKASFGGAAQLNVAGDQVTVILRGAPADALAQWLTQARVNARAQPTDARLSRNLSPAALEGGSAAAPQARWDGTLVLRLPPR